MSWFSITIPGDDDYEAASARLIEDLRQRYEQAGKPQDANVFHRRRGDGSHTFFFSPPATSFASPLLAQANAAECEEPVGVDKLVRVKF